jgi:hypothetical protein
VRDDNSDFDESEGGGAVGEPSNVYFLSLIDPADPDRDFSLVKVGFTTNDVEKRIAQLQTGNPYQIQCAGRFQSPVARQVERWVHRTNEVAHLEWLRLARHEIPGLVESARQQAARLAEVAEANARWRHTESKGKERQAGVEDRQLQAEARENRSEWCRLRFRLRHTRASIALNAGAVLHIPGVVRTLLLRPAARFSSQTALGDYAPLAVCCGASQEVGGKFRWRDVPTLASSEWLQLRFEVESLEQQQRDLDAAMLGNPERLLDEGKLTDELASLHGDYLTLTQLEMRLNVDMEEMKMRATILLEDCPAIVGVCSYRRSPRLVVKDKKSFKEVFKREYPNEAAKCTSELPARVRRGIYLSRSY